MSLKEKLGISYFGAFDSSALADESANRLDIKIATHNDLYGSRTS